MRGLGFEAGAGAGVAAAAAAAFCRTLPVPDLGGSSRRRRCCIWG